MYKQLSINVRMRVKTLPCVVWLLTFLLFMVSIVCQAVYIYCYLDKKKNTLVANDTLFTRYFIFQL